MLMVNNKSTTKNLKNVHTKLSLVNLVNIFFYTFIKFKINKIKLTIGE